MKKSFFSRFDWAAFWVATLATLAVYFCTLGPSVGLEDSGELATAGAHLGVPHPPGYPFWTLCSWVFCKVFSFVTYMGHPTPAWAISLCSAVFGAFAAGCTAMLICRSAHDVVGSDDGSGTDWLCFGGGVGGALAFSFSPVEWSQSTIVEIYSLNALFLMWVFLLSYRWMRRPSDKILWFTAFVFGLGLTNYQVLLFAIVPIAIIICLKNFRMFRDFFLYLVPVALAYQVLKIGEMPRATYAMDADVISKHEGLLRFSSCPSTWAVVLAVALLVGTLVAVAVLRSRGRGDLVRRVLCFGGGASVAVFALAALGLLAGDVDWSVIAFNPATSAKEPMPDITAPLVSPRIYVWIAALIAASVVSAVAAGLRRDDGDAGAEWGFRKLICASAVFALLAVAVATFVGQADAAGYEGKPYSWTSSEFCCAALVVALFAGSLFVRRGLCYAIPVAGFHVAVFILLRRGAMNGLTHPSSWWFWWPVAWNFVVLALAWLTLPNGRSVAGAALFAQLGVSFYAYMPIVSDIRNPPMNWGYPREWEGFKHAITRGQYEAITLPAFKGFAEFWKFLKTQMGHYFSDVKMQFSDFLAFFALVPFACWSAVGRYRGRKWAANALWAVSGILGLLLLRAVMSACGLGTGPAWQRFDRFFIAVMAVLSAAGVLVVVFKQVFLRMAVALRRFLEVSLRNRDFVKLAAFATLVADVIAVGIHVWMRPKGNPWALAAILAVISVFAPLVLCVRDMLRLMRRTAASGCRVSFSARDVSQQWLLASGACFFMMTVPLIVLAQVKGDLQDGFIQKVKFISSHAMIALWIGYGLAFVGVMALRGFAARFGASRGRVRACAFALAAAAVLGAGVVPIVQNYADDEFAEKFGVSELVHKLGGSEQNGHTFGWQFGAYQLDGAKAVREQLTADEEPLPDPDWPPPMEPYSIFFGGTDPGRFVPTYMIYSANFRPDVYLITQNALADETYMKVERDLYGDEIWIPSKEDSGKAFDIYVTEVRSGVRQANGDLKMENGRVQVTGALGVMEINGILTKMMFDHDRKRHAFYVEESYSIPWMYPYLSPHGLIMKLNADKTPYDAATAAKDRDFWDWYMRRLVGDPMYRRDFAAQKSFSKLRAAIAGLYRTQGRVADALQAFREANLLYPASPEATFRYVSEVLMPMDRLGVVKDLMDYTDRVDPNNQRTRRIRSYVEMRRTVERIEAKFRSGSQTKEDAYDLAIAYDGLGHTSEAAGLMAQMLPMLTRPEELHEAARILVAGGRDAEAEKAVARYSDSVKSPDPALFADLAVLQHGHGRVGSSYQTIDKAARLDLAGTVDRLTAYVGSLQGDRFDVMLALKLAKLQMRAGRRTAAVGTFSAAYRANHAVVEREVQRDREVYKVYMAVAEEQRRYESQLRRRAGSAGL